MAIDYYATMVIYSSKLIMSSIANHMYGEVTHSSHNIHPIKELNCEIININIIINYYLIWLQCSTIVNL